MENSKTICTRVPIGSYDQILLYCDANGTNVSEWLNLQMAKALKSEQVKEQLSKKLFLLGSINSGYYNGDFKSILKNIRGYIEDNL